MLKCFVKLTCVPSEPKFKTFDYMMSMVMVYRMNILRYVLKSDSLLIIPTGEANCI